MLNENAFSAMLRHPPPVNEFSCRERPTPQKRWDFAARAENSFHRQLESELRRCPIAHGIGKVLIFLGILTIFPTMPTKSGGRGGATTDIAMPFLSGYNRSWPLRFCAVFCANRSHPPSDGRAPCSVCAFVRGPPNRSKGSARKNLDVPVSLARPTLRFCLAGPNSSSFCPQNRLTNGWFLVSLPSHCRAQCPAATVKRMVPIG
jgi:hypothetical protein